MDFRAGELRIEGRSWAGEDTWFRVHPPGLAFDVGRGALQLAGAQEIFLSHGHLDHVLGLPFVLSQRSLHGEGETRVFCPPAVAAPLADLVDAASRLEEREYRWHLVPLQPGDRVEVGKDLVVEAFSTRHAAPSLGYRLLRRRRRLAAAFRELSTEELVELKSRGEQIEVVEERPWVAYCGDVDAGTLDQDPSLYEVPVLMIECTFLAAGMEEKASRFGHIHLADLVERRERFRNQAILLHHLSRRHDEAELRAAVLREMPELADRIHLLLGVR